MAEPPVVGQRDTRQQGDSARLPDVTESTVARPVSLTNEHEGRRPWACDEWCDHVKRILPTPETTIRVLGWLPEAILLIGSLAAFGSPAAAQTDSGRVTIAVCLGGRPLPEALVRTARAGVRTDAAGRATLQLPTGLHRLAVTAIGVRPETLVVMVHPQLDTTVTLELVEQAATLSPVVVASTRVARRLEDEPVRVEVLAGDDIDEKTQMRPADLTVLLREISGVRMQPTSPALGAANIRVQGQRGRYTQVLTDGLPLSAGQPGGLGLLQIPHSISARPR